MKPIYSGFDGLEFAIKAMIPPQLDQKLADMKALAQEAHDDFHTLFCGLEITVRESGARGGYAYSVTEHATGNWFCKRPKQNDPWGIRFSASSAALVLYGFEGLRLRAAEVLSCLGIDASVEAYSPSRVDFAVDFLAPDFVVSPNSFVIHARTGLKSFDEFDEIEGSQVNGRSSRTTSVTVGKMPGRQVIIYDKREEVIAKRKHEWAAIWGRSMNGPTASPLDLANRATSQVWRVELRVGKRHLKDAWDVNSWASLYQMLPCIYEKMLDDISYCMPTSDKNRSRWPNHPIWMTVRDTVASDLFDHIPRLAPEEYIEIKRQQKLNELEAQATGLIISMGGIEGILDSSFSEYGEKLMSNIDARVKRDRRHLSDRLAESRQKYSYLVD